MPMFDLTAAPTKPKGAGILDAFWPRIQHLTSLSDADDGYCLIASAFPAGVVVPIHSHADRETFFVLDGELKALREDFWTTLISGDVFDVPGGTRHGFRNPSGASASLLLVTTMRMGRFFRDIGRPAGTAPTGPPKPADLLHFAEIARRYGHWLGGFAEKAAVSPTPG